MKQISYKSVLMLSLILAFGIGCSQGQQDERAIAQASEGPGGTNSGVKYEFFRHGSGKVPPNGGYWTLNITYFDQEGNKMFSTDDRGGTMPMRYDTASFSKNSSLEECFSLLGKGDSAVFYISADSLYQNSYGQPAPAELQGTKVEFHVGVVDVFTPDEFDDWNMAKLKDAIEAEKPTIEAYIKENNLDAQVTSQGVYYEITEMGTGNQPQTGQTVKVNYTGYLLDGTIFDTSVEEIAKNSGNFNPMRPYQPIEFPLGEGQVIKGWDIGISMLPEGSKAKLIIPSPLAYGDRGAGGAIKPNSILVFDVELVEIVK